MRWTMLCTRGEMVAGAGRVSGVCILTAVLWDIGLYSLHDPNADPDSQSSGSDA